MPCVEVQGETKIADSKSKIQNSRGCSMPGTHQTSRNASWRFRVGAALFSKPNPGLDTVRQLSEDDRR